MSSSLTRYILLHDPDILPIFNNLFYLRNQLMTKSIVSSIVSFLIAFFCIPDAAATDIQSIGVPYVQNYTKSVYRSGNQNWSVTRDENGVMYFGNSEGLLSFDGRYWQLYRMPNGQIVRAVASDGKGRIYVGCFGEFGYWSYSTSGKFKYTSLLKDLPKNNAPNDEIWKIYTDKNRVIFQSFGSIYIYENNRINAPIRLANPYLFLFKAGNRYFIEVITKGLYELKGKRLDFIPGSEKLTSVLSILPFKNNSYLIGTSKNGLFVFDESGIRPWQNQANEFLKTYQLNNGTKVLGKYYVYGTILNGLVILDSEGNVVQRINKSSGLQNNTVLSLFTDQDDNLWTGLDNGIDRIDINSPLYFYFDKTGKFGTVYSSIIHNNKIYIGTNQGLFYSDWVSNNRLFQSFDFKLIQGSQGQVWDLSLIGGELLCGHNDGTFRVSGDRIEKISDIDGGWMISRLNSNPETLIQGTYTGLVVYKRNTNGNWEFSHRIRGFTQPSRYVEPDSKGNIWVSHAYKGLYKLGVSADMKRVLSSKIYNVKSGLPASYQINVFNLGNRNVFSSSAGFYIYDDISDRFFPYKQLNEKLGSFSTSSKVISASASKNWFINYGKIALVDFSKPGKLHIDSATFNILEGRMVQYYENISRISDSIYLISVDDGFVIFNAGNFASKKPDLPAVLIRKVENTADKTILLTEKSVSGIEIPYSINSIRISYALPYFSQSAIRYQYFLEGYSRRWSEWSTQSQKEFTNMPPGDYKLEVRALVNNERISPSGSFAFSVLPPWYRTIWAFMAYVLLISILIYIARQYHLFNLKKHKEELEKKLQREKEEHLQMEAAANEQRIVKLKNEQLEADLESKSRELANSAMNIVTKNELLQKLREEISLLKDDQGNKLPDIRLRRIQKVIEEGLNDERDWNLFENSFNEAHENFFKKIKAGHPDLVPNDLKLCAYLRMSMSSKEIAALLNITLRGVEIRRYRLRKKLNLPHDKNLTEFLMEV